MTYENNGVSFSKRNKITRAPHMNAIEERFPLHEQNENARLLTGAEYAARHPDMTVPFDRLPETAINGFPIRIERDRAGGLRATFNKNTHALIVGSTGSGKTTGFVVPFMNWMAGKKDKPIIIISDAKDELRKSSSELFKKNGYDVHCVNFKDFRISDCWNPLTKIFKEYQKLFVIENEISVVIENGKYYNSFKGTVYRSQSELDAVIAGEKDNILQKVSAMIGNIAETVSPVTKKDDPFWEQSSAAFISGFLWAMLEDSDPEKEQGRITEHTFNFDTMIKIYDSFTNQDRHLNDHGYFTGRDPETSQAYQLVTPSIIRLTAPITRSCIISCFSDKIKKLRDTSVRKITCANTIDIRSLDDSDKPTVIFISYKDEDSLHYGVISMFISDLYTSLIDIARRKGGSLTRPCYFLLDEFGNFPTFKDFEHVISACRSRNIWFLLVVQSYAQLYRIYGKETADIIIDNLNMHIFYGSCNYETKAAFSNECGKHEITSAFSSINGSRRYIEHYDNMLVPLVPISRLSRLADGECIITQMKDDVIWSKIERSYLCPEYSCGEGDAVDLPSPVSFFDPKYNYDIKWLTNSIRGIQLNILSI